MKSLFSRSRLLPLGMITAILTLVALSGNDQLFSVSEASGDTSFSGRATVVQADVLGLDPVVLSDTSPLPPEGGSREASLLEASVPDLLTAEVLHAAAVAQDEVSRSEASVANLDLTVAGHQVSADFLMSRAMARCEDGSASVTGSSEVAGLVIDGESIEVSGSPNQTVTVGGLTAVINEQSGSVSGNSGEVSVKALHITVVEATGVVADVVISSSRAGIECAAVVPGNDLVTGGGWITGTPSGARANFGIAGGIRNGKLWGHLTYIDHGDRLKVKGTSVTAYRIVDQTTRVVEGSARINGRDGFTYTIEVADHGEPGRADTLAIRLSNGYTASGSLDGGNLQVHR